MFYRKDSIYTSDFSQTKELSYHASELDYHQEYYLKSIQEAQYHLSKAKEHFSMINELKECFTNEAAYVR